MHNALFVAEARILQSSSSVTFTAQLSKELAPFTRNFFLYSTYQKLVRILRQALDHCEFQI